MYPHSIIILLSIFQSFDLLRDSEIQTIHHRGTQAPLQPLLIEYFTFIMYPHLILTLLSIFQSFDLLRDSEIIPKGTQIPLQPLLHTSHKPRFIRIQKPLLFSPCSTSSNNRNFLHICYISQPFSIS